MKFTFNPHIRLKDKVEPLFSIDELSDETMLYSASLDFALDNGGPITRKILGKMIYLDEVIKAQNGEYDGLNIVIDTRCHMLMKGMYPAIPGWHCDAFPRHKKYAQPDLLNGNKEVKHYICLVSNVENVSRTQFALDSVTIDVDEKNVWKSVSRQIKNKVENKDIKARQCTEGDIIEFDQQTLHCALPCVNPGWRFFLRLSFYHSPPINKIRKQVQVYTNIENGW